MTNQNLSKADTSFGGQSFLSRVTSLRHASRINLIIQLLDDTDQISLDVKVILITFNNYFSNSNASDFQPSAIGQTVLDMVCEKLNIVEREFFGLRFQDNNKFRVSYWISFYLELCFKFVFQFWLDLTKPINKQFKGKIPHQFVS